jgi:hypothetical protein
VPLALASTTVQAAIHFAVGPTAVAGLVSANTILLAEGVLKTMLLAKLKLATAVVLMVVGLCMGIGALGYERPAGNPEQPAPKVELVPTGNAIEQPAQEKKAPPSLVIGVVKAVDAGQRSLTISHREGEGSFKVADNANIRIDGKPSELAKLPVGAHVYLSQFEDGNKVQAIQANGPTIFGSVKAVDSKKNTITVKDARSETTYSVPPDTEITIDGEKGGLLANIPKGANLHALNLCVDQKTALNINVEGASLHHVPVKAVDADRLTITFDDKAPGGLAGQTYFVAKDAAAT